MTGEAAITIAGHAIGAHCPPYVIAEMSANHNGSIDNAFKIIEAAKQAGADAVKLQTYRPDTITLDCDTEEFRIHGGLWDGRTLYQLYAEAHMPWEWHAPLFEHARKLGITIFSSPFDNTAVDLLEDLNAPAYKIASFEAVDLPLIKYVASTGKPMIISTGMADVEEIEEAIAAAHDGGCKQLAILHCVSGYPAPAADYNLRTISDMIQRFGLVTGLSDHTMGTAVPVAAVALGACVIEKPVTLARRDGGVDSAFSLEPAELARLVADCRTGWEALGQVRYGPVASEATVRPLRRSLYVIADIAPGEVITARHVRSIRPGLGLPPKHYKSILGRKAAYAVKRGTPLDWTMIKAD